MSFDSLRAFLQALDAEGEIAHVETEVDRMWEIAAVTRQVLAMPAARRPALLFQNIAGFSTPLCVGLYTNRRRYARALGVPVADINQRWMDALRQPLPVERVATGPCKENILTGEAVDIGKFPLARWAPEIDAGTFFTAQAVMTRDPDSPFVNVGTYRMMYRGRNQTALFVNPIQDIGLIFAKHEKAGTRMEVAVAIGADPAVSLVAPAKIPRGVSELEVAGALKGSPVQVVKGETVDLEVPASAEIVLEGYLEPGERVTEGPFGEFAGYLSPTYQMPVFHITAVTHRNEPILHSFVSQKPPSESSMLRSIALEALVHRDLEALGVPGVREVCVPEAGCAWYHFVVSIRKSHPAHARLVMNAIWAAKPALAKRVVVVDEDVDVRDPFQVEYALATCVQPHRDVTILPDYFGQMEDPSAAPGQEQMSSKLGIDATRKHPYPPVGLPDRAYLERAVQQWDRYGIAPLDRD